MMPARDLLIPILLAALFVTGVRADEIVLRATARVAPGADATLADVAELSGPGAQALAGTVIIPASELSAGWVRAGIERVNTALGARGGIAWGTLSVRGSECSVIAVRSAPSPSKKTPVGPDGEPAGAIVPGTIRSVVAARVIARLGAPAADIRLSFDPRDADLLSMPAAGRIVEARFTGDSDTLPVRVTVFEGEAVLVSRAIGVGVTIRRTVAVAQREVRRGRVIDAGDLLIEDRWVGPSLAPLAADSAVGAAARTALHVGQIVTASDVQPPVVIKRGDLVNVSSIAGGVLVRVTARAMAGAREGEVLALESLEPDRKQRRTFSARASGRGQAVVAGLSVGGPPGESEQ